MRLWSIFNIYTRITKVLLTALERFENPDFEYKTRKARRKILSKSILKIFARFQCKTFKIWFKQKRINYKNGHFFSLNWIIYLYLFISNLLFQTRLRRIFVNHGLFSKWNVLFINYKTNNHNELETSHFHDCNKLLNTIYHHLISIHHYLFYIIYIYIFLSERKKNTKYKKN